MSKKEKVIEVPFNWENSQWQELVEELFKDKVHGEIEIGLSYSEEKNVDVCLFKVNTIQYKIRLEKDVFNHKYEVHLYKQLGLNKTPDELTSLIERIGEVKGSKEKSKVYLCG